MPRISSTIPTEPRNWPQVYLAIALTTLATLTLELSVTRIFSVVFYYHFAFLAISIALFGLGVGGVFSYLIAAKGQHIYSRLGILAALTSLAVILSLVVVLTRTSLTNATLALIYFTSALPFLLAGTIVSLAISETIERVDRVYFFDLIGAAGGCLLLVPFLEFLGGPNTVVVSAVLFAVSSAIWWNIGGQKRGRAAGVALALALVTLIVVNSKHRLIDVKFAKGHELTGEEYVKWNSFSRIALGEDAWKNKTIFIDADASTAIANFDYSHLSDQNKADLFFHGPGFVYQVRPSPKALIIGPGGGWDVARALSSGSKDITGVEINPIIATTIMRRIYPRYSGNLYDRPEVRIVVEDGRSFVRRSTERYQVLQATLVDTWASTAAGAFALSENNLYTTDAFYDYLTHLTGDGILSFTRWGFDPPRESLRLLSLAKVALDALGETDTKRHVIVVRENVELLKGWGATDTVLISRKPFTAEDLRRARDTISKSKMQAVYLPDESIPNAFTEMLNSPDLERFYQTYQYNIRPVNDNRPFFFYSVQPRDLLNFVRNDTGSADYKINRAVPLLFGLMGVSIAATSVILILPPLLLGSRLPREAGVARFLLYFVCLGAGYILIQVALIQKFVVLLGQPTYALWVIIFSMLISSGLGSFTSRKIVRNSVNRLAWVLLTIAGLVLLLAFSTSFITHAAIGWPLSAKLIVTAVSIAPAAFVMGIPFPTGLGILERWHKPSVRWAWALNAASSVLGSASAIFFALYLGLRETLIVGAFLYLLALCVVKLTRLTPAEIQ